MLMLNSLFLHLLRSRCCYALLFLLALDMFRDDFIHVLPRDVARRGALAPHVEEFDGLHRNCCYVDASSGVKRFLSLK